MTNCIKTAARVSAVLCSQLFLVMLNTARLQASEFEALDEAYRGIPNPSIVSQVEQYSPVFDFTNDSCLPAAAISRSGQKNGGLATGGEVAGDCRSRIPTGFREWSNTYHRWVNQVENGIEYSAHLYDLYFEKDQVDDFIKVDGWGHRHDVETAIVYFTDGEPTHMAVSAHGDYTRKSWHKVSKVSGHPKVLYYSSYLIPDGGTHSFTFGSGSAQNPDKEWLTPAVVSWYEMIADGVSNETMRNLLNTYSYGKAGLKFKDSNFINSVNKSDALPDGYPVFTQANADLAQIGGASVNSASQQATNLLLLMP